MADDADAPREFFSGVVLVPGPAAVILADLVRRHSNELRDLYDVTVLTAVAPKLDAIDYTAKKYLQQLEQAASRLAEGAGSGTGLEPGAEPGAPSAGSGEISASEAALILDRSPRTVRKYAARYGGRLVGGRWVFDRAEVEAAADSAQ